MGTLEQISLSGTKNIEEIIPLEYLSMYEISGQDPINTHSFDRYLKDKDREEEKIKELEAKSPFTYKKKIHEARNSEKFILIEQGLSSDNIEVQKASAEMIFYISEIDKRSELEEKVYKLIENYSAKDNVVEQRIYAEMIRYVPERKMQGLIEQGFLTKDIEVMVMCAEMIHNTPKDIRGELIELGLNTGDLEVQKVCAGMIRIINVGQRYNELQKKVSIIIEQGLASGDIKKQKACAEMIRYSTENKRASFIEQGLAIDNTEIQIIYASAIWHVLKESERNSLAIKILELIEQSFTTGNFEKQKAFAEMVSCAPKDKRSVLIKMGLDTENTEVQKAYTKMIWHLTGNEKKRMFDLAKEKLGNAIVEPPLYDDKNFNEKFSRTSFEKTGSETTLVGGELKNKTIIRHIKPETFLVWERLFEDYNLWQKAGFDYVPIEPIQSFKVNKDNLVDVYSGVLDLSLQSWEEMSSEFNDELNRERDKILQILKNEKIVHGHSHDSNFCLRFFRDKDGGVDFSRKPRIYLIDFDQAFSLQKDTK